MDEISFRNIDNKFYPNKNMRNSFYIDHETMLGYTKLKTLTLSNLLVTATKNEFVIIYWRFVHFLYSLGFIDMFEYDSFSWKKFTLKFWRTLQKRKRILKT